MSKLQSQSRYFSGFNPLDSGDCALWLDASDPATLTLSGSDVTQWNDKSGNGRNTSSLTGTATLLTNSVNSKQGIYFNGSSYFKGPFSYSSNTLSWYVVGTVESDGPTYGRLLSFASAGSVDYDSTLRLNALGRLETTTQMLTYRNSTTVGSDMNISYTVPFLMSGFINGTSNYPYLNGTLATGASSTGNFGFTTYGISGSGGDNVEPSKGYIFEILTYSNVPTITQRQLIEGYLRWKWNLNGLPTTHPYYGITPVSRRFEPIDNPATCTLWIDGKDSNTFTLSGSNVAQWNDKSGFGYNLSQTTSASRPVLSNNYVVFSSDRYLNIPFLALNNTSTYSIFLVFNPISSSNWIFCKQYNNVNTYNSFSMTFFPSSGGQSVLSNRYIYWRPYNAATRSDTNVQIPTSTVSIIELLYDNSNVRFYRNGALVSTTASAAASVIQNAPVATNFTLGVYISTGGPVSTGITNFELGEMMFFAGYMSEIQRQQVEGYLARKWNISLPYTAAAPSGILPTSFGNCSLWVDAGDSSSLTFSGANITQWNDKSGNGYNLTQATAPSGPVLSNNYVAFSTNRFLDIPQAALNNLSTYSIFLVINPIAARNWIFVKQYNAVGTFNALSLTYNTSSGGVAQIGTSQYMYWRPYNAGTQANSTVGFSLSLPSVFGLVYNGANMFMYRNGSLVSTTASVAGAIQNQTSATNFTLGVFIQNSAFVNTGVTNFQLGEMVFLTNNLSDTERQQMEGYLAWKWGIQQFLPPGHPYGTNGFPISQPFIRRIPSTPLFNPRQVSNCVLWLDAADPSTVTLLNGTVNQLRDKSSNGFVLSNGVGFTYNQTLFNGKYPSFYGSAVTNYMIGTLSSFSISSPFTAFTIGESQLDSTIQGYIFDTGTTASNAFYLTCVGQSGNTTFRPVTFGGSSFTGPVATNKFVGSFVYNGASSISSTNGATTTGNVGTTYLNTLAFNYGVRRTLNLGSFKGHICETIIYTGIVSDGDRRRIEGYLAWKWGLQSSLPTTHPYRLIKP